MKALVMGGGMAGLCSAANLAVGHILEDFLGVQEILFSKPTYFTPYPRSGATVAAGLALGARRGLARRMRAGRGDET